MMMRPNRFFVAALLLLSVISGRAEAARDAAFMSPGGGRGAASDDAILIEPKSDVDVGDTPLNTSRRATFFFVNQSGGPVEVDTITANGDSNVKADLVGDDCTKEKKIATASRCSVTVEVTPTGMGSWTAELLMTHKSAGRIARARVLGKTSAGAQEKREMGLSLNTKEVKPVDFGEVEVGVGKAVRSALMINDSNEVITLLSIEIIAADNGLQRLDQGCLSDMDLKMGESCPITMVWKPESKGSISTDLIIRHSGRLGFAVIPVRGVAKEAKGGTSKDGSPISASGESGFIMTGAKPSAGGSGGAGTGSPPRSAGAGSVPMSPTADELEGMLNNGSVPPISADVLPSTVTGGSGGSGAAAVPSVSIDDVNLIGTVGNRAIIYKPDGTTAMVDIGDTLSLGDGTSLKLLNVSSKEAEVFFAGKKRTLKLKAASTLMQKAASSRSQAQTKGKSSKDSSDKDKGSQPETRSSVPLPMSK